MDEAHCYVLVGRGLASALELAQYILREKMRVSVQNFNATKVWGIRIGYHWSYHFTGCDLEHNVAVFLTEINENLTEMHFVAYSTRSSINRQSTMKFHSELYPYMSGWHPELKSSTPRRHPYKPRPDEIRGVAAQGVESARAGQATIFISYRREDTADVTGRLCDRLATHFGDDLTIVRDVTSTPGGADYRTFLLNAVRRSRLMLVLIGPRWHGPTTTRSLLDNPDDMVRMEIEAAIECNVAIIPLLVHGMTMPPANSLPTSLHPLVYRHALPIRNDPDFRTDVERLLKGIPKFHVARE